MSMRPITGILLQGLRHVAIGVAVLAVLMTAFRVHVHGPSQDGHVHADQIALGFSLDGLVGASSEPQTSDSDGCDCCTCPPSHVMTADGHGISLHTMAAALPLMVHPAAAPDSRSYPPDPPPARLS